MATYIAPIGDGLGDLIVSLPAIQGLIGTSERVILVLRSPRQEGFGHLIPGLAGWVREIDIDARTVCGAGDRFVNLRDHPLQTDYVWGSEEFARKYPGYKMADIISHICRDIGIDADFENLQPLPFSICSEASGKVLFIPGSVGEFKCWRKNAWLELARSLELEGGQVAVVGEPDVSLQVRELIDAGLAWIPTPTLKDALDAVSSARAVISVDTGLMHLALHQLVPCAAIWINNPGSLNYLRTVRHCFPIVSPRCSSDCVNEEFGRKMNLVTEFTQWCGYKSWTCHAGDQERCMNNVSVDAVLQQALRALEFSGARI